MSTQRSWTGSEDDPMLREPYPPCPECGAGPNERCRPMCDCEICVRPEVEPSPQGDGHGESGKA